MEGEEHTGLVGLGPISALHLPCFLGSSLQSEPVCRAAGRAVRREQKLAEPQAPVAPTSMLALIFL